MELHIIIIAMCGWEISSVGNQTWNRSRKRQFWNHCQYWQMYWLDKKCDRSDPSSNQRERGMLAIC